MKMNFFELINTEVSPEIGENVMSLAKRLRQEGRQETEINLIIKMLNNGLEPKFIAANTDFPLDKIIQTRDSILQ